jgi:signal transduction histidine kinase
MLLVVVLAVGLITVLDVRRAQDLSRQKFEEQGLLLAEALNETLANPLYFLDINTMGSIATTAASQADLRYVQVFRPDGQLLVDTSRPRYAVGSVGEELIARVIRDQQSVRVYRNGALEVIAPVRAGSQVLGGVRFGFDTSGLNAEIRGIMVQHLWQGSFIVIVGVVLSFVLAQNLVRPLHRLVEATKRIGEGEAEFSAGERRDDEIGDLSVAFEKMSARLARRTSELNIAFQALQNSRRRIVQAQEELRKEVAEQLHGPVQSRLLVASHWLLSAQKALGTNPDGAAEYVNKAAQLIKGTTEGDLRNIAHRLHPSLIRLGLLGSLRSLTDTFWPNLEVEIYPTDVADNPHDLWRTEMSEELRLAMYRVVEEAFNNVLKHAKATKVTCKLDHPTEDRISMTFQDNGQGFDVQTTTPGFGIFSMQDYCATVGGTLEVQSQVGKGTVVIASFPLAAQPVEAPQATAT